MRHQKAYELTGPDLVLLKKYYRGTCSLGEDGKIDLSTGNTKEAYRQWLRWKILHDLYFFGSEFLGWRTATNKLGTRYRIDPVFHKWLCRVISKPGSKMVLVPRGHLKSTWVKLRIVQLILLDPNVRIGLFSATSRLVTKHMAWIRQVIANPKLRELFPSQIPDPKRNFNGWEKATQEELIVWRDPDSEHPTDAPQLLAVGEGAEIVGFHFDYAFLDDVVTDDNVKTASKLAEIDDWWEYLQPILEADAEITIIGTPYHYHDLYARIRANEEIPRQNIVVRKNIEGGKIIYASWWKWEDYERLKKRMRPYKYSCQYECNPVPDEDRIFPPPQPKFSQLPGDEYGYRYYCLIDPAATQESYSDHTAIVVIAVNHLNQVFVIESFSMKKEGDEIADFLIRKHLQYGFKRVGIEFGLQAHLDTIIKLRVAEHERVHHEPIKLNIQPIPIKKVNKRERIDTMIGPLVRTGKIFIFDKLTNLEAQMDNFTGQEGDEDDEIDALSMAPYVIESFAQHKHIPDAMRRREMSWRDFHKKKGHRVFKHTA